jgi:hypothetical protein
MVETKSKQLKFGVKIEVRVGVTEGSDKTQLGYVSLNEDVATWLGQSAKFKSIVKHQVCSESEFTLDDTEESLQNN